MNTKKLFMLLAAVLLGSVSAFAQSGNNEPLKGDVNEDGTVDVADIVDVIKILKDAGGAVGEKMCYWYVGSNNGNAVTAGNFTDVASRIPESEIPETGSVTANGQYVYFVMPESRHLESLTYANGSAVEFTFTNVMGYHIYKTTEMINTTLIYTIKQTTYYWYVGRQDYNAGSNAIGTADWETTNYDVFINSNDKQSATSLNDIKTALTGSVNVGAKSTGKEDVVIIAPTSVINQITSIKNASDAFNVAWEKMNPSNGYTTVFIGDYYSTTLNIHF